MYHIFIKISYDGTNYKGFQKQPYVKTIQEEIEKVLKKLYQEEIKILMAGRTDSGVHAMGQVASFKIKKMSVKLEKIPRAMNTFLPDDIVIVESKIVNEDFHPRYFVKEKIYEYKILNAKYLIPQMRNYVYFYPQPINLDKLKEALKYFEGTHNFKSFSSKGSSVINTTRTINEILVTKENNLIIIKFRGKGFLYNMIRIIIGTALEISIGRKSVNDLEKIFLSKERKKAGETLPPNGLILLEIIY